MARRRCGAGDAGVAALAAAVLAACGGSTGSAPAAAPDEVLFQAGLTAYDAARAAESAAPPDPTTASARYAEARATFDRLLAEHPSSQRRDNAAYLAGRCSYERAQTVTPTDPVQLQDAVTRLAAVRATWPGSALLDQVAYFEARARFLLGQYAEAAPVFELAATHALATTPPGVYLDNASYYVGRSRFEEAMQLGASARDAARAALDAAEAALEAFRSGPFRSSTYFDNAMYYLGRSHFEEPVPVLVDPATGPTTTLDPAVRGPNLDAAIAALDALVAMPGATASIFYADGRYWRGRAHYARATNPPADAAAEYAAAVADFRAAVAARPAGLNADNALYHEVRAWADQGCGTPANQANACEAYRKLQAYSGSRVVSSGASYLASKSCTCP